MMRILFRGRPSRKLGPVAAAALVLGLTSGFARAAPPVWHIHGAHADITLFGSVHLLADTTSWKTPALEADLAHAQAIWFEIPVDAASQAEVTAQVQTRGTLPAGQQLSSLLSPEANARLVKAAQASPMPVSVIERFKPWMADLLLTVLFAEEHGAKSEFGVEQQIAKDAPPTAERGAFETVAEQIDLFADQPQADQIASLNQDLEQIADDPGAFDRIAAAWARWDAKAIVKEAVLPLKREAPGVYAQLLVARNRRFAAKIEELLAGSQQVFITVGVAHLVGPDSVPAMLRNAGVRVEGP
ncbi:MAG: TraB/GumN family protein [Caulobacteraceae bacterium]